MAAPRRRRALRRQRRRRRRRRRPRARPHAAADSRSERATPQATSSDDSSRRARQRDRPAQARAGEAAAGVERDIYFKKQITLPCGGKRLQLRVAQDLFSSHEVDAGTRLLLKSLERHDEHTFGSVLDLGCGYGPIGLALRASGLADEVHLVDRDALALEYARQNAAVNELDRVEVYASLGYDDVEQRDFGLIASNIPAKAGAPVIQHLLLDAAPYLRRGGIVAVVVVAAIASAVSSMLDQRPEIDVLVRRESADYTVLHYRFRESAARQAAPSAFERGIYDHGDALLTSGEQTFRLRTVHGLEEGDGPSAATRMLTDAIAAREGAAGHTVVTNPGQGFIAVALADAAAPRRLTLVDRDLLALRIADANLERSGFDRARIRIAHAAGLPDLDGDAPALIAGVLREDEGAGPMRAAVVSAARQLAAGGELLLAGGSTAMTRAVAALERVGMILRERKRRKGTSVARLAKAPA